MFEFDGLKNAMSDLDEEKVTEIIDKIMADGGKDAEKAMEALNAGIETVGEKYEQEEYFIGDLIFSGEMMTACVDKMRTALVTGADGGKNATILFCTVKGDLHDIGKNIVKAFFEASGFNVVDLGIDVAPETIVNTLIEQNIKIAGLSGVLTSAIDSMKKTVDAIKAAGLNDVKIVAGGACINQEVGVATGADFCTKSPHDAIKMCRSWLN